MNLTRRAVKLSSVRNTDADTEQVRLRRLVDRWSCSAVAVISIMKLLQSLRRLGLHPREDGFRRLARTFFLSQEAHPCTAVFGLRIAGAECTEEIAEADAVCSRTIVLLREFFASRPDMHNCLRWTRLQVRTVRRTAMDLVRAEFTEDGRLTGLHPYLDPDLPPGDLGPDEEGTVCGALVRAYNTTRLLPDRRRPLALRRVFEREMRALRGTSCTIGIGGQNLADRLLHAIWVDCEVIPAEGAEPGGPRYPRRTLTPPLHQSRGPGTGGFVITAHVHADMRTVDLWFHFHHALFDGAPFAEMLADLERQWGIAEPLVLPSPAPSPIPRPRTQCSGPAGRECWALQDWLDFSPLLAKRESLHTRLAGHLGGEGISIVSLLLWGLAHHEAFRDVKFTVALDVPATERRERTIGIAPIRPAVYSRDHDPDTAFVAFNKELTRRIRQTRERRGEFYEMLESIALLPAVTQPFALALLRRGVEECMGTLGISLVRELSIAIPAQNEIHVDGILGLGRFDLPTEDGGRAGIVTVKGPPDKVDGYLLAMREVVACG